jgi:hypothetical protein
MKKLSLRSSLRTFSAAIFLEIFSNFQGESGPQFPFWREFVSFWHHYRVLTVNCLETHRQLVMSRSSFSQDVTFMSTNNHIRPTLARWRVRLTTQIQSAPNCWLSRDSHLSGGGSR